MPGLRADGATPSTCLHVPIKARRVIGDASALCY